MQFGDFHEIVECAWMDALDFVGGEIQDSKIRNVPQMPSANVSY